MIKTKAVVTEATLTPPSSKVGSIDRLSFALFLAIVLHVTVIIGISFDIYRGSTPSPSIEVTLATSTSEKPPEDADYLAQENQQGGGELAEAATPSVTQLSEHVTQETFNTTPEAPPPSQAEQKPQRTEVVTTLADVKETALNLAENPSQKKKLEQLREEISQQEQSMGLVSRDAKLDLFDQLLTKERVLRVNSVSTLKTHDAFYVKQWIDKIERVGRMNYPTEALRRNIEGTLKLTVVLLSDGTIRELRVARSSGHQILDDAAINIVRRAGHFPPFTAEMKKQYDRLEITREWQFTKDGKNLDLSGGRI